MASLNSYLRKLMLEALFAVSSCLLSSSYVTADDSVPKTEPTPASFVTLQGADENRWMIILCSLSGDEEHEEKLTLAVEQLSSSAGPVFGVKPEHLRVLLSSKEMSEKTPGSKPCDRSSLAELAAELMVTSNSQSQYFFFLLGHSHLRDRSCQFNIVGPDIDQLDYAKLFGKLPGKEQVHWIGLPASGYWIKPLSGENRTIITATEADLEITATEMPFALGAIVAGTSEYSKLEDIDKDGRLTLMDLYLAVDIEVHQRFVTQDYLPTEHAQLDDNGDGRGAELQESYLPKKEGELPVRKIPQKYLDGEQSRRVMLGVLQTKN